MLCLVVVLVVVEAVWLREPSGHGSVVDGVGIAPLVLVIVRVAFSAVLVVLLLGLASSARSLPLWF